jgi:hypothetical protein
VLLKRVKKAIRSNRGKHNLLGIALSLLTTGKTLLLQLLDTHRSDPLTIPSADFSKAAKFLNRAVDGLREAGAQEFIPLGFFARTTLFRHQQAFPEAWVDLTEAYEIAILGQMRLHLCDYHLEAARLIQAQLAQPKTSYTIIKDGVKQKLSTTEMAELFKTHVDIAATLIQETGYRRRDAELAILKEIALYVFGTINRSATAGF